jgi:antirestriction protein
MEIANKVERKSESNPRIYVACLSAYNSGTLHGTWIDANQDADGIHEEIQQMLKDSPEPVAEEWRIDDYEGFGSFRLAEYEDIETVSALARLIDEFGEMVASTVWGHVCSNTSPHGGDSGIGENHVVFVEARRVIEECYQGAWESLEAYAEDLLESTGELDKVPEHLRPYIDVAAYARDLELGGDVFTVEEGCQVHVFWGR